MDDVDATAGGVLPLEDPTAHHPRPDGAAETPPDGLEESSAGWAGHEVGSAHYRHDGKRFVTVLHRIHR